MPVETAADLASMFDEDEFAEAAVYLGPDVGDAPSGCRVIVDRGQGRARFDAGGQQAVGSQRRLWVQIGAGEGMLASAPARHGTFTLEADGEELKVAGLPEVDHAGVLCSCDLVTVG